jgi:hypothetical protein
MFKSGGFYPAVTAVGENMTPIVNLSFLFIIKNKASTQNFIILGTKLAVLEPFKVLPVNTGKKPVKPVPIILFSHSTIICFLVCLSQSSGS